MILISLLLILFLEYQFKLSRVLKQQFHADAWFGRWLDFIVVKLPKDWPWLGYLIQVFIPVLIVMWLAESQAGLIISAVQFVFVLIVLGYSLGPIDQNTHLDTYFEALKQNDLDAAADEIQNNLNQRSVVLHADSIDSLGRQVTNLILRQCNFRLFGVLFYFVIFGIGGALAYNLVCSFEFHHRENEDSPFQNISRRVRHAFDWLPQRITGLLYGLAGDFNGAMQVYLKYFFKSGENCTGLLEQTGLGALGFSEEQRPESALEENYEAMALVSRSAMVFVLIIAILTVFGWLN